MNFTRTFAETVSTMINAQPMTPEPTERARFHLSGPLIEKHREPAAVDADASSIRGADDERSQASNSACVVSVTMMTESHQTSRDGASAIMNSPSVADGGDSASGSSDAMVSTRIQSCELTTDNNKNINR